MIEKTVECPKCKKIFTISGEPGKVVKIKCSQCGLSGKVTFEKKPIEEKTFDTELQVTSAQPIAGDIAIEVNDLRKVYGDLVAVNNISFKVKSGEVFAFLGIKYRDIGLQISFMINSLTSSIVSLRRKS